MEGIDDWEDWAISEVMLITLNICPVKLIKLSQAWESRTRCGLCRSSIYPGRSCRQGTRHRSLVVYLMVAPRLTRAILEPAILFRMKMTDSQIALPYFLDTWKHTIDMAKSIQFVHHNNPDQKFNILTDIRNYCINYAGFSLIKPDIFDNAPRGKGLCSYLLYNEIKLPEGFLNELARRFYEDGLIDIIGSMIMGIFEEIASINFNENYMTAIRVHPYLLTLIIDYDIPYSIQINNIYHARYPQLDPYRNI